MAQVSNDLKIICETFVADLDLASVSVAVGAPTGNISYVLVSSTKLNSPGIVALFSASGVEMTELYLYSGFHTWDLEWELETRMAITRDFSYIVNEYVRGSDWLTTPDRDYERMPHPEDLPPSSFREQVAAFVGM